MTHRYRLHPPSPRREDYPTPCFSGAAQGDTASTPGVWVLPPGLLASSVIHTVTVSVAKPAAAGTAPLTSSASVTFRPRPAAEPFPRGTLTRQCAPAACAVPHATDQPLVVRLDLAASYTDAAVAWSSPDIAASALASVASAATDAAIPPGVHYLTVAAAALPATRGSVTLTATLTAASGAPPATGLATITMPLAGAPYCTLSTSPDTATASGISASSPCISIQVASDTFPNAAVVIRADGWADPSAQAAATGDEPGESAAAASSSSALLRYEFGVREASGTAVVHRTGSSPTATLVGLPVGRVEVYGCAVTAGGARACGGGEAGVAAPTTGFDLAAALGSVNVTELAEVGPRGAARYGMPRAHV